MAITRKFAILVAGSAGIVALAMTPVRASDPPLPSKDFGTVELSGATWLGSFDAAVRAAKASGRPILHLQMFGRLDDAYC